MRNHKSEHAPVRVLASFADLAHGVLPPQDDTYMHICCKLPSRCIDVDCLGLKPVPSHILSMLTGHPQPDAWESKPPHRTAVCNDIMMILSGSHSSAGGRGAKHPSFHLYILSLLKFKARALSTDLAAQHLRLELSFRHWMHL